MKPGISGQSHGGFIDNLLVSILTRTGHIANDVRLLTSIS